MTTTEQLNINDMRASFLQDVAPLTGFTAEQLDDPAVQDRAFGQLAMRVTGCTQAQIQVNPDHEADSLSVTTLQALQRRQSPAEILRDDPGTAITVTDEELVARAVTWLYDMQSPDIPSAAQPAVLPPLTEATPWGDIEESDDELDAETQQFIADVSTDESMRLDVTDQELLARIRSGDNEAIAQLYDRYHFTIEKFVLFRAPHFAEDFASQVFLRAIPQLRDNPRLNFETKPAAAWLITIARNLIFDEVKSARHKNTVLTAEIFDAAGGCTEREALASLSGQMLWQTVGRLSPEQRDVILLRFRDGLSVDEAARAMDKTTGALKAMQYRALRNLHRLRARYSDEEQAA